MRINEEIYIKHSAGDTIGVEVREVLRRARGLGIKPDVVRGLIDDWVYEGEFEVAEIGETQVVYPKDCVPDRPQVQRPRL